MFILGIYIGDERVSHLFRKQNRRVSLWEKQGTEDGARTSEDHHDPKHPPPPQMAEGDTMKN
jgi:hypothetical protein